MLKNKYLDNIMENQIVENTPSLEDLPRYKRPNPFNYDDETIAKKDKEVLELMQLYPNQDRSFIEQVWDMTFKMNDDEWTDFKEKCKEPAVKRQPILKPIEILEEIKDI